MGGGLLLECGHTGSQQCSLTALGRGKFISNGRVSFEPCGLSRHTRVSTPLKQSKQCSRLCLRAAAATLSPQAPVVPESNGSWSSRDFSRIEDAIADIAAGGIVVVLDDEDRENEGDLIMAADKATPQALAFIVEHSSGVVCVGMPGATLDRLQIPLMVPPVANDESMSTAFTVTVDLREGTTTGISAADRAATIRGLAHPSSQPQHFRRPGHIFPLRARPGGVLVRPGHTEAAMDLSLLAGCQPCGVLCEVVDKRDGSMARTPQLLKFAAQHNLKCITIAELIKYRLRHDALLTLLASETVQTAAGQATMQQYRAFNGACCTVVQAGGGAGDQVARPVAICREDFLSDVLHARVASVNGNGNRAWGSRPQVGDLVAQVVEVGGVLVYLRTTSGQVGQAVPGVARETVDAAIAAAALRETRVGEVSLVEGSDVGVQDLLEVGVRVAGVVAGPGVGPQYASGATGPL